MKEVFEVIAISGCYPFDFLLGESKKFSPASYPVLFGSSLIPQFGLIGSSGTEDEQRRIRGGKKEAMRRSRGEIAIHRRFSRTPSQVFSKTVTFLRKPAGVCRRFTSAEVVSNIHTSIIFCNWIAKNSIWQKNC
jgi:hypothetical protein